VGGPGSADALENAAVQTLGSLEAVGSSCGLGPFTCPAPHSKRTGPELTERGWVGIDTPTWSRNGAAAAISGDSENGVRAAKRAAAAPTASRNLGAHAAST